MASFGHGGGNLGEVGCGASLDFGHLKAVGGGAGDDGDAEVAPVAVLVPFVDFGQRCGGGLVCLPGEGGGFGAVGAGGDDREAVVA